MIVLTTKSAFADEKLSATIRCRAVVKADTESATMYKPLKCCDARFT